MKKYIEITKDCAICAAVLIGIISAVCGVVTFPILMAEVTDCGAWLLGYIGYIALCFILKNLFID